MPECIVMGTGPSLEGFHTREEYQDLPKYGCGNLPINCQPDIYCYGSEIHAQHIPKDCEIRTTEQKSKFFPGSKYLPENIPHAGNSGGLAISHACLDFDVIGLIGFDDFDGSESNHNPGMKQLREYWEDRGKTFISLMPTPPSWL